MVSRASIRSSCVPCSITPWWIPKVRYLTQYLTCRAARSKSFAEKKKRLLHQSPVITSHKGTSPTVNLARLRYSPQHNLARYSISTLTPTSANPIVHVHGLDLCLTCAIAPPATTASRCQQTVCPLQLASQSFPRPIESRIADRVSNPKMPHLLCLLAAACISMSCVCPSTFQFPSSL